MEEIYSFLEQYTLVEYEEKEQNIFQIAGFPHYENVSSNVLAYFLEKNNIVLYSLLSCISGLYDTHVYNIENVKREEITKNNNRIDILINTNKSIIGIENKINAWLYNPVDDYYEHLQELAVNENKEFIFIVLSKNSVEKNEKYINILYSDFAVALRKNYAQLLGGLGFRYFFLLNEYVENIENLNGGFYMNEEFVKIAQIDDNSNKISQIAIEAEKLRAEFKKTASCILADLKENNKSFKSLWIYDGLDESDYLYFATVFQDYFLDGNKYYNITIDVGVSVTGYSFSIFERDDHFDNIVKNTLKNIIPELSKNYHISNNRYYYKTKYDFQDYEQLITTLKEVLKYFTDYSKSKKHGA
jgi:hypothetical protein